MNSIRTARVDSFGLLHIPGAHWNGIGRISGDNYLVQLVQLGLEAQDYEPQGRGGEGATLLRHRAPLKGGSRQTRLACMLGGLCIVHAGGRVWSPRCR